MIATLVLATSLAGFYEPADAPLAIESKNRITLKREGLRDLSLRVTYPKAPGSYPIIVFSHGMYGSEDGSDPLVQTWAKRGYVVIQPTHDDSLRYADAETRRKALQGSLENIGSSRQRPKDITLILDSLSTIEAAVPGLKGKMDRETIGMGGHSFGAWTTQVMSGMTLGAGAMKIDAGDKRIDAFLVISPQGKGGGVSDESFKAMRGPMMMISGDNDRGRGEWDPKVYRREAFNGAAPGGKTLVWIKDAYHGFGGINGRTIRLGGPQLIGDPNPTHVKIVQSVSTAFWDSALKKQSFAEAWLTKKEIEKVDGVKVSTK